MDELSNPYRPGAGAQPPALIGRDELIRRFGTTLRRALAAKSRKSGFLLAIDEVQYLSVDEMAALIMAVHRTTQANLPVVLAGVGLPQLPGIAGDAKSYAERLFDFPEIGSLTRDDAAAALLIP